MTEIQWEDPPQDGRSVGGHWSNWIKELQQHPGKWAVYIGKQGQLWHNSATHVALRRKGVELRTSTDGRPSDMAQSKFRIWGRWPEDAEQ